MSVDQKPKKTLAGLVGAGCAAALLTCVPQFEGMVLRAYKDPIGIVTACAGHTMTAVMGRSYTREECDAILVEDLIDHAEPVLACTPGLQDKPQPLAAAISFAFNVGTGAYCKSTMAKKFNAGDFAGACAELSRWVYAGGKQLPGLVKRRETERAMCEGRIS